MKLLLVATFCMILTSCGKTEYVHTKPVIFQTREGYIFKSGGDVEASGPFKELHGPTGHADGPINCTFYTDKGDTIVAHPAVPGYAMQIDGFINKDGDLFWLILKWPNTRPCGQIVIASNP